MKNQVFQILSNIFDIPVDSIDEQSSTDTIDNWDSLNHIRLIMALEEEFAVSFTDDQIVDMLTVESIIRKLKEMGIESEKDNE